MTATSHTRLKLLALFLVGALSMLALPATSSAAAHRHHGGAVHRYVHAKRATKRATISRVRLAMNTTSPASGTTVSGTIAWQVGVSGTTPSRVDFAIDGAVESSDSASPYAFGSGLDTTTLSNGSHTLTATAYARKAKLASSTVTVNVQNSTSAPSPSSEPAPAPEEPTPALEETAPAPAPTPAPASIYWGAWIGSQLTGGQPPWDMSAVTKFEEMTGKRLSLVHFSSPFSNCSSSPCSFYKFPAGPMENIRAHGSIPFFSWASQSIPSSTNEPNYQLSDVISGTYDSYIREFASAAKAWGHPFFLRFNWEMNGRWFPWSEGVNGNKAGEFVAAWRHVHDIFTSVGATNATWVWCPNVDPNNIFQSLGSLYPGNEYVDWTGLDGYNWGTNPVKPDRWRSFNEIYKSTYGKIVETIAPSKPMAIGEMGSTEYGGSKASWISDALSRVPTEYPKIRALLYFEKYDSGMDWPIETSATATSAFAAGIQNPAYATNTFSALGGTSAVLPTG
jgi:mannan endo-1,4-beta-mannosidase